MSILRALSVAVLVVAVAAGCGSDGDGEPQGEGQQDGEPQEGEPLKEGQQEEEPQREKPQGAEAFVEAAGDAFLGRSARGEMSQYGMMLEAPGLDGGVSADDVSVVFSIDAAGDIAYAADVNALALFSDLPYALFAGVLPHGGEVEFRHVDGENYLGLPAEALAGAGVELAGDTAWFAISSEEMVLTMLGCGANSHPSGEGSGVPCNPFADVAALAKRAEGASVSGSEDVAGVPTTIVRFQVPFGELGMLRGATAEDLEDAADLFGEVDEAGSAEVELWADGDGLPRRVAVDMSPIWGSYFENILGAGDFSMFGADGGEGGVLMLTTVDFYDFDAVADIEAPPAESVIADDYTRLLWDVLEGGS